ncbi:DinB superfamily protein [Botrimarina colliarenosi]|uniref:DinB superfamily protein n=1 Tax=Botrimarina colliarenosi TaxID=2528001 RepID=A0A5C6AAG2_9BACT|nr:DinB family protein [Botrimarina colliarenosi]TWT95313.1 DinB superfamily protein [Botrimarina colliarenosi]
MRISSQGLAWLTLGLLVATGPVSNTVAQEPVTELAVSTGATLSLPTPPNDKKGWAPEGEFAELLERMGDATAASREVFKPLSATQMNWRPPNGTHTPRWNAEHLAATQLRLFSQVYAALDPDHHTEISIGPEQMPDAYVPAHPTWSGAQEAEQMERIGDYVRGFAYLLEDADLDKPVKGTRWAPRKLMDLMVRHYGQHTANVEAKFTLPDWPKE